MMNLNKFKLSHIVVVISLLFAGCDSNLVNLDPI